MAVKLQYVKGHGMFTAHLDHQVMCGTGPCGCKATPGAKLNYKNGRVVGYAVQPVRHPAVLTLRLKETSDLLPDRVLRCPEVVAQMAKLKVTAGLPDPVPEAPPAAPEAPPAVPEPPPAAPEAPSAEGEASDPTTPRRARR